jgi:hypothetical protein
MCRVVWEKDAWLFLKRWGGLPEMVMTARHRKTGAAEGVFVSTAYSGFDPGHSPLKSLKGLLKGISKADLRERREDCEGWTFI